MRKIILLSICLVALSTLNAQVYGRFRLGLNAGYAHPKGGHGIAANAEVKYNIFNNFNIGVCVDYSASMKIIDDEAANMSGTISYLGTADLYFNSGKSSFAPFIGGGAGYFQVASVSATVNGIDYKAENKRVFGGMLRAGFENARFRFTAYYNFIPKSEARSDNSSSTFEVENAYWGLTIGFYFGGGHWLKN